MRRFALSALVLVAASLVTSPAAAERRGHGATDRFGPDCRTIQRLYGQSTVVVGTVLGGQNRRGRYGDGTYRDYRHYQACFASVEACQAWAVRNAAHHPLPPGYARCTPVYVGLTPPTPTLLRQLKGLLPGG